jgi:hypothetical protein
MLKFITLWFSDFSSKMQRLVMMLEESKSVELGLSGPAFNCNSKTVMKYLKTVCTGKCLDHMEMNTIKSLRVYT